MEGLKHRLTVVGYALPAVLFPPLRVECGARMQKFNVQIDSMCIASVLTIYLAALANTYLKFCPAIHSKSSVPSSMFICYNHPQPFICC